MKITKQQQKALLQIFTAKGWPQRIGAIVIVAAAAFTVWQKEQIKPGQMVKGGQLMGEVVTVSDGDTVVLQDQDHKQYKLRLAFIDAPEKAMSYGKEAQQHLNQLIYRQQIEARIEDVDAYGRGVARIIKNGEDINYAQVAAGYAWHYSQYAKKGQDDGQYAQYEQAQENAKRSKTGLWRDKNPTAPWQWRRENKQP